MAARRQVTRSVTVPAPPERVGRVLAEPGGLAGWLGTDTSPRVLRVENAQEARLELWWCAPDTPGPAGVSVVRVVLEPAGEGSRVTVTETALGDHPGPLPPGLELPGGGQLARAPATAGAPAG